MKIDVHVYQELMENFLQDRISVGGFEKEYLELFKTDSSLRGPPLYNILNRVFLDIDAYCPDAMLESVDGIGERELRERVKNSLNELHRILDGDGS